MLPIWVEYALILSGFVMLAYALWGLVNFVNGGFYESNLVLTIALMGITGLVLIAVGFLVLRTQKK